MKRTKISYLKEMYQETREMLKLSLVSIWGLSKILYKQRTQIKDCGEGNLEALDFFFFKNEYTFPGFLSGLIALITIASLILFFLLLAFSRIFPS